MPGGDGRPGGHGAVAMPGLPGIVRAGAGPRQVVEDAALWLAKLSDAARQRHGYFSIALSQAEIWRPVYLRLAQPPYRDAVCWPSWYVLFTSGCSRDDAQLTSAALESVPLDPERVFPMPDPAPDPHSAAGDYAELLADLFLPGPGGAPRLDCVLLDLAEDGHAAGIADGSPAGRVRHVWVASGRDARGGRCITLTRPVVNAAAAAAFMVTGRAAARLLRDVGEGSAAAASIHPSDGELVWFVDEAALTG